MSPLPKYVVDDLRIVERLAQSVGEGMVHRVTFALVGEVNLATPSTAPSWTARHVA